MQDFSHLIEMEKTVAGLSSIYEQIDNLTSVSAQIVSIQRSSLIEDWQRVIAPPSLIDELALFSSRQYELIEKNTEDAEWRLGLVSAASRYVDRQVQWGTLLAIDCNEEAPDEEVVVPDFNELGTAFASAKRDGREVNLANSQMLVITDTGKIIVEKARIINDYCRVRGRADLFPADDLVSWAMVLSSTYCRDSDAISDVMGVLYEMFVRKEIVRLIGRQECFGLIENLHNGVEKKKSEITKIQHRVYQSIIKIEDLLINSFGDAVSTIYTEEEISKNVHKTLLQIQGNKAYRNVDENTLNDGMRDRLKMIYDVKDQTRQGISANGHDAGEVDLVIYNQGTPICVIEALKVNSLEKDYIKNHIDKALVNYDPFGCTQAYIVIYSTVKKFDDFWKKLMDFVSFPYETFELLTEIPTNYTASRHARAMLQRDGKPVSVHLFAVKMEE